MFSGQQVIPRISEPEVGMPDSGGPTHRKIWKAGGIRDSDVVAPTTIQEESLIEAGALRNMLDAGSLEDPNSKGVATILLLQLLVIFFKE